MLIMVQKENEQDQAHIFQYTYFESFQIHQLGADPEILKRGDALSQPPWLAGEKGFRFQMI